MRSLGPKREKLRARDGDNCQLCREPIDFTLPPDGTAPVPGRSMGVSIDHKIPRSLGGSNRLPNLQLAHGRCNQRKGSRSGVFAAAEQAMTEKWFASWSAAR